MMTDNVIPLETWKGKIQKGRNGPKKNMTNLMLHMKHLPGLGPALRHNELSGETEWKGESLTDADLIDIRLILENAGFEPGVRDIYPAVLRHALENKYHPIRDYLSGLKWDGNARLNHWMVKTLGAEDNGYTRAVSRRSLISAVARAYKPGCKVDTVLVLEGPQGLKKSTAIAELFGPDHTAESVSLFDQHNKMVMQMQGNWCVELAEFVAFFKKDKSSVKGLISMRSDRVVLPYAKMASNHPRQCIFFGTINPDGMGYLTDDENRRYWPVAVSMADIPAIREHRDQIWAEAVTAYNAGEQWWLTEEEETLSRDQVAEREVTHPWDELVEEKLRGINRVTIVEALRSLGVPNDKMDRKAELQMGSSLRQNGFVKTDAKDENRKSFKVWIRS